MKNKWMVIPLNLFLFQSFKKKKMPSLVFRHRIPKIMANFDFPYILMKMFEAVFLLHFSLCNNIPIYLPTLSHPSIFPPQPKIQVKIYDCKAPILLLVGVGIVF